MKSDFSHEYWMAKAIQQARKGLYSTHPNPRVGCVIVRDNECLAKGFHEFPGGPHAEINALSQLNGNAKCCTVYVSLEPCSHAGKTPPCAAALIKAQPDTVVIAMKDPNPLVEGRGIKMLEQAGIKVISDVLQSEAEKLNPGFIKRMIKARPFVSVKMAMSLDGRIALANGDSFWITGEHARKDVQKLRAKSSAILSTAKTVMHDDASLNVRLDNTALQQDCEVRQPVRVILDRDLRLTGKEKLFEVGGEIWIFTTMEQTQAQARFSSENVKAFNLPLSDNSQQLDLSQLFKQLASLEINEIHTECGPSLAGSLIQQGLVDELIIYMAPSLLGSQAKGVFDLGEIQKMSDKYELSINDVRSVGADIRIKAILRKLY